MDTNGLCQCGCGQLTRPAKMTHKKSGAVKGQPQRFIFGHHNKSVAPSQSTITSHVEVTFNGCWNWIGSMFKSHGYGRLKYHGKSYKAHRISYTVFKGEISQGLFVCHTCDNPRCVNPDHLFLGTPQDNVKDMVQKGRGVRGIDSPSSKLTEQAVIEIFQSNIGAYKLAKQYQVTPRVIYGIKTRRSWKHVTQHLI